MHITNWTSELLKSQLFYMKGTRKEKTYPWKLHKEASSLQIKKKMIQGKGGRIKLTESSASFVLGINDQVCCLSLYLSRSCGKTQAHWDQDSKQMLLSFRKINVSGCYCGIASRLPLVIWEIWYHLLFKYSLKKASTSEFLM